MSDIPRANQLVLEVREASAALAPDAAVLMYQHGYCQDSLLSDRVACLSAALPTALSAASAGEQVHGQLALFLIFTLLAVQECRLASKLARKQSGHQYEHVSA